MKSIYLLVSVGNLLLWCHKRRTPLSMLIFFLPNHFFFKNLLTVYSCRSPPGLLAPTSDHRKIISELSEPPALDLEGEVEVHGVMLPLRTVEDCDDGAGSSSVPSARGMIRAAPAQC